MFKAAVLLAGCDALVRAPATRAGTALGAVWSDSRAVLDYQNMLSGMTAPRKADGPALVLGTSPIAQAWAGLAPGTPDDVYDVAAQLPMALDAAKYPNYEDLSDFPIYVFCEAAELEGVIQRCPPEKKDDLVFMHCRGEMIEPILKRYGCLGDTQTNALLYIAVNDFGVIEDERCSIGDDAMGEGKWAAESSATGKWVGAVVDRMERNKLHCSELFNRDWRRHMFERVAFETVYGLVGNLHKKHIIGTQVPISEVNTYFGKEVTDMMYEIQRALRGHLALTLLLGVEERMAAYASRQFRSKSDNRPSECSMSNEYRNAFFYGISMGAKEKGFPDPCPMHTEYWEYAWANDLLDP